MGNWNFADVYEVVAGKIPDVPCQVQGHRTMSWAEFDGGANGLARHLLDVGLGNQAKVAAYLTNCPAYLGETVCALVEAVPGHPVDADALVAHVKRRLASYKAPRTVLGVDTIVGHPTARSTTGLSACGR